MLDAPLTARSHATRRGLLVAAIALLAIGCEGTPAEAPSDIPGWMVAHADDYLNDRAWRRAELEASMWQPALPYAKKRLDSYALPRGGWDLLPELASATAPVMADGSRAPLTELLPAELPQTAEGWRALGRQVFWSLPMRRDAYLEWLVSRPELWDRAGLQVDDSGQVRGLVRFTDARGDERVGVTCALCHGAEGAAGRANRALDLGWARAQFVEARGRTPGAYAGWGPGRVDVTDDPIDDPLAIADLWSVRWQSHLNTSGAVRVASPASIAVRFETQFITGHAYESRPPRALVWALGLFVQTLDRPDAGGMEAAPMPPAHLPDGTAGASVFAQRCAGCHDPQRGFGGDLVAAEVMVSDSSPALSPMRGTGFFKVPGLLGVSQGGPYLHDGSQPTLDALLQSGHPMGEPLPAADRAALVEYLSHL